MIAINAALPDWLPGDQINVRKMAQLTPIVAELEELARLAPPVTANIDVANTLRVSQPRRERTGLRVSLVLEAGNLNLHADHVCSSSHLTCSTPRTIYTSCPWPGSRGTLRR